MIFRLKRKKQRKHSWIVLRAINRMNGYDTKENNIDHSGRSSADQSGRYFLTS